MTLITENQSAVSENNGNWPRTILEAYRRWRGPYTVENASALLQEEPLELYNGWLVWKKMTDAKERRIAGIIQEILSIAARAANFAQAYPDQFECEMVSGDIVKPDVCLVSHERFKAKVIGRVPGKDHFLLEGGPELVVEIRSRSNTRKEEAAKRQQYFESGTLVVWDVEPEKQIIWVYEVENPEKAVEYKADSIISCERLLPGWRRTVKDFFTPELSAEQIVGEVAQQWRAESRAEGRAEGLVEGRAEGELAASRKILVRLAQRRFGAENLPADFESRLNNYTSEQLDALVDSVATSATIEEWLASFPA